MPPSLHYRDFRLFVIGLGLSATGTHFTTVAMAWQIYLLTGSPLQLGLLGLTRALPQMALALVGGVLADRMDRRRLMIVTQVAQALISVALMALTVADAMTPALLFGASVLYAVCSALEFPVRQAIIPNLVPPESLTSALAVSQTLRNAGAIVGPALAGVLIAAGGTSACYATAALAWGSMVVALLLIAASKAPAPRRRETPLQAVREGVAFVWRNPVLLSLMVLDFGATIFGEAKALYPIYAEEILTVGATGLGILHAAPAAGTIVAAVLMSRARLVRHPGAWVLGGVAVYGLCTAAFAVSTHFWLSVALLAGSGAGNLVSAVLRGTIVQLSTPNELRGRVSSVNSIFAAGGPQLGQFEAGAVAQAAGAQVSAFSGGVACLLLVLLFGMSAGVRRFQFAPAPAVATGTVSATSPPRGRG